MISEFSFLGIGLKTTTRKSRKISVFESTKFKWFFDHYFNFLSAKTKINKNVLNLINLDGLEAFKRQTPGTLLEIWVNNFEFDVIWRASQLFFKLYSHNSVLWRLCSISVISEFSYLGVGLKMKTRKSRKIFIFWFITLRCMWICVLTTILTVWMLKLTKTKTGSI